MLSSDTLSGIIDSMSCLYEKALVLTRNAEDAKDLVQDVMVKALSLSAETLTCSNTSAWLTTVMRNHWLNVIDNRKVQRAFTDALMMIKVDEDASLLGVPATRSQLARAFSELPLPYLQTLEALVDEAGSYRHAAEVLNLPLGTIATQVGQSRSLLQKILERKGDSTKSCPGASTSRAGENRHDNRHRGPIKRGLKLS